MFGGQQKSGAFGQTPSSFSFGQSAFSKPAATGFGANTFGQQPNTSVFGAQQTGSLFGQAAAPPQPAFGSTFGQPQTSIFGATNTTGTPGSSLFGTNQTSAFNAAKPTGFGFGQPQPTTSLFGQTQPQQQNTSLFGQSGTSTTSSMSTGGLFNTGATTSAFGQQQQQQQQSGTAVAKFQPPTETDTLVKGSSTQYVQTKQQCITFMKEYAEKSLEELRYEDYAANRKGPQQQAGGLFAQNPVQQSTGMFGQSQPTASLFGQQQAQPTTGLFGSNPLGSTTAGFGTNTASTGFGATTGGLFGKPLSAQAPATTASTFGNFGTTQSNAFGFNKPIGQATPSLFGQQAQPAAGGFGQTAPQNTFGTTSTFGQPAQNSLFGGATSSATPAFGTLGTNTTAGNSAFNFGNNNPAQNTGGLFGAPKPTFGAATTGFGTAPATSNAFTGFGTANQTQGGLFGNAAKPPTFGLGQTTAAPTFGQSTGGSLFGQTNNQPAGGLFGSTTTNPSGGGLFGHTPGFGNTTGATGGLFGSSQPSMFNTAQQQQQPQQQSTEIHQRIFALTSNPYGDNELFKNLKPVGLSDDALKATNPAAQKALLDSSNNFKISPNSSSKIKVKPISAIITKKSLFDGLEENDPSLEESFTIKPNPKRLIIKPRASVGGANKSINEESLIKFRSDETKVIAGKENDLPGEVFRNQIPLTQPQIMDEDTDRRVSWLRTAPSQAIRARPKIREASADTTINQLVGAQANKEDLLRLDSSVINNTSILNETFNSIDDSQLEPDISIITGSAEPHPTGITLRRAGYYTIPSLDELIEYIDDEGHCFVPNFAVGRKGYGNVYFDEEIDVANLNLDEICHFRNKEIILYQDDDNKPPVGEGLNRKAQVTLDQIWPHDKHTHEPIKDPAQLEFMGYEAKLRRICEKRGTKFLDYRPETGSCVFKVDHFSKYTLDDSDDDGTEANGAVESEPRGDPKKAKMTAIQNGKKTAEVAEFNRTKQPESTFILGPHPGQRGFQPSYPQYDVDDAIMREPTSPSVALAKDMKTDTHKLQLMKASFFVDDDYDTRSIMSDMTEGGGRDSPEQMVPSNGFTHRPVNFDAPIVIDSADENEIMKEAPKKRQENLPSQILKPIGPKSQPLIVRPRVMLYDISDISLPASESILKSMINEKNASIPFLNGRKFKIGWGLRNEFTLVSSQASKFMFKGRLDGDLSKSVIKIQQIKSMRALDTSDKFKKSIVDHLKIELKHDKRILTDTTDCHRLEANGGTEGLYEHFELAQKLSKDSRESALNATIWSLMQALWGSIENEVDAQDHTGIMMRRDFFSNWLENVVIDSEITKSNLEYLDRLVNLFMCHKISDACELTLENDDLNLSLLIAQTGGGPAVKQLIQHQLCCWHEVEADNFIDERRLRILMMIGGVSAMEGPENSSAINIFENHNWLKCLALQLWYVSSPIASTTDALIAYEQNFENEEANVAMPLPAHKKNQLERDGKYFDIRFHLLKLFSQRSHPLETLLHPAGYSTDLMDYRLSFLIAQCLESLGYCHLSVSCKLKIYTSLAEQLETNGMWEWSVWIMLHIVDQNHRETAVQQLLYRHIRIDDELDIAYSEKEKFLVDDLQIPEKWIFWSKAVRAGAMNNHQVELKYLLKAQQWSKAHDTMMRHIAPDLVINDQVEYLKSLLLKFEVTKEIQNWKTQGEILLNFIELNEKFISLSQNIDENIDEDRFLMEISPKLSELCSVIRLFPCPTPKHRLCQCEIAKQLAFIIRNFYAPSNAYENQAGVLMRTALERLPLPQEYAQQEMKYILAAFLAEKITTD